MRRLLPALVIGLAGLGVAGACRPDLGAPQSVVDGPRILAVRADLPEVAPGDAMVTFDALVVDVDGRIAMPDLAWMTCNEPHPPAESNIVSVGCLNVPGQDPLPDDATGTTFKAAVPAQACVNFGPQVSKPGARPTDADTTGGYYQPVRATWKAGAEQTAFGLERIRCSIGGIAPTEVAGEYQTKYKNNVNPVLASVTLDPEGAAAPLYATGQMAPPPVATVAAGQAVTLEAAWPDTTPESFLVYDITSHELVTQRESLRVSWFATAGEFQHERGGRGTGEPQTFTRNVWTAPTTPGTVHMWMVLRDSRGGVDFAETTIEVTP